jgi:hypothetical protein
MSDMGIDRISGKESEINAEKELSALEKVVKTQLNEACARSQNITAKHGYICSLRRELSLIEKEANPDAKIIINALKDDMDLQKHTIMTDYEMLKDCMKYLENFTKAGNAIYSGRMEGEGMPRNDRKVRFSSLMDYARDVIIKSENATVIARSYEPALFYVV